MENRLTQRSSGASLRSLALTTLSPLNFALGVANISTIGARMNDENNQQDSIIKSNTQEQLDNTNNKENLNKGAKWEIRTVDGIILPELELSSIEHGLQEGWLTVDDEVRQTKNNSWSSIRGTLGNNSFLINAFINPQLAYAKLYSKNLCVTFLVLSIIIGFSYYNFAILNLGIINEIGILIGIFIIVAGFAEKILFVICIGLAIIAFSGGFPIEVIYTKNPDDSLSSIYNFSIKLILYIILLGGVGATVGYAVGFLVGWFTGFIQRDAYKIPAERTTIPDFDTAINKPFNDKDTTALIRASEKGDIEIVQTLLTANPDINGSLSYGMTALMLASKNGHTEVVQELLSANANVNSVDFDDLTALIVASNNGHVEIVKALLDSGAEINAKRSDGLTALKLATQNGHTDVVKLLKDAGGC